MRSLLSSFVALAAAVLPAQQPEPWRVIRDLEFRGAEQLPAARITEVLLRDNEVLGLLTGTIGAAEMPVVAAAVRRVYLRNGFADAVVTAAWEQDRGVVEVTEGPRRTCGEIRCVGNAKVSADALRAALREKTVRWRGWPAGEPAATDPRALAAAATVAQRCALEAGLHGAAVTVAAEPRGDTIDLVVTFTDEGCVTRVQSLELVGERADARDAVLAGLEWTPGDVVDGAWLADLRRQLAATGRYRSVALDVPEPAPEVLDPLRVQVDALPHEPPVTAAARRDIAQLQRAIDRVQAHLADGRLLRFRTEIADELAAAPRLRLLPGALTLDLGEEGVRFVIDQVQVGGDEPERCEVIATPTSLSLQLGDSCADVEFAERHGVGVTLATSFLPDGTQQFRWGIGISTSGADAPVLSIDIHPATAGYLLYGPTTFLQRDGDDLLLTDGGGRIGPDGVIAGHGLDLVLGDRPAALELPDATLSDLRRELRARARADGDGEQATSVQGSLLVALVERLGGLLPRERARLLALVPGVIRALRDYEAPQTEHVESPARPGAADVPANAIPAVLLALSGLDALRGWPADLCGALGTLGLGRSKAAAGCFANYTRNEAYGPVAMIAAADALEFLGSGDASRFCRILAWQRWSFDAVYRDLAKVVDIVPHTIGLARAIGAEWRGQEDLAELFADLPPDGDPDLAAWRRGLEVAWEEGLGEALRQGMFAAR